MSSFGYWHEQTNYVFVLYIAEMHKQQKEAILVYLSWRLAKHFIMLILHSSIAYQYRPETATHQRFRGVNATIGDTSGFKRFFLRMEHLMEVLSLQQLGSHQYQTVLQNE